MIHVNEEDKQDDNDDMRIVTAYIREVIPKSKDNRKYASSRAKEIDELIERGVFSPAHINEAQGYRIYGSHVVDFEKHKGTPEAFEKSRFVAQIFNDKSGYMKY